MILTIQIC